MNHSVQPGIQSARWRRAGHTFIATAVLALSIANLRSQGPVTNAPSTTSNPPMKQFVFFFRQSRQLSEAEQKQRRTEVVAWVQRQNSEGHKIEPRMLGAEKEEVASVEKPNPSTANQAGTLSAINFLEARDFAQAIALARSHPALRYGGSIEVRPWASPVAAPAVR